MNETLGLFLSVFLVGVVLIEVSDGATTVDYITPNAGSSNGGTRITIHGKGFAKTQFNYGAGNEHLGNFVELVSGTHVYVCDIHVDGCTNITVTCNTRPMPNGEYNIRLKVDGVSVPDSNYNVDKSIFTVRSWNTPTISSVSPTSGVPGTLVTVCGRIISTRFGSNLPESENGLPNKLLRIYHNGQVCEVKEITDTANEKFYGIWLDNPDTLNGKGCFKCKMSGTYVANQNFSFIVEGEFGRSKPDLSVLSLNANGKISMFQTYAVIKSVSPTSGSVEGGTVLTITGENFDQTDAPAKVSIGGVECDVTSVKDTEILCTTPVKPTANSSYTGNRGLLHERWSQTSLTFVDRANILTLSTSAADYTSSVIDTTSFSEDLYANSVNKLSGYLIPSMTAKYRFYLRADDYAALSFSETGPPSDMEEVATCSKYSSTYWKGSEQTSREFSLTAGTPYYIQIVQGNAPNTSSVYVALRSDKSPVTASMSGDGLDEIQEIMVNSTVSPEEQVLTLSGLDAASTSYTSEKQTVSVSEITGGNVDTFYRLGLYGVYTAPIPATADSTAVEKALNELASYAPDTVSVAQSSPSATSEEFVITFQSGRGNLPLLTTMVEPRSSSLSVSVSANTDGRASKEKAYLQIDGVVSPGIAAGATKDDVQAALNSMFGVRCPPVIASPADGASAYIQDFEGSVSGMGEVVMEVEPLCGRKSLKNPKYIYQTPDKQLGIKIGDFRTLCFGYQGAVSQLKVQHDYKGAERRWDQWFNLDLAPTADKMWNYTCMDIGTTIVSKNADKTLHRVWRIEITRESEENDLYVDTVALLIPDKASSDLGKGINLQRYKAAKPGGYPMREISVTGTGPFTVTMSPFDCGNGFDLFKVADSQTTVSVGASRNTEASPPVTGSFNIEFGSRSLTIPVTNTITEKDVQVLIENEFSDIMGSVSVVHQGDCSNFAYTVTFITNRGDQAEMTIPSSNLRGNSPVASIKTTRNGGAFFDPIPGDMLRTSADKPQVVAMINNVPTACDGSCTFEWDTSSTPAITATSPASGTQALSTVLTIDGSGFSSVNADNSVMIGGVACVITAASANQITCSVGNGPMGQFPVVVNIQGKGQATGSFKFTYTASADSITPTSGSFGGGTVTTVSGSGFASDAVVQVDGVDATVIQSQPGEITFYTPKSSSATTRAVSVTVQQYSNTLTIPTQFTYSQSLTPTITSTSITETSVFGGDSITISGSGFGGAASPSDALKINGETATITAYSDTQVVATLPANPPGTYTVDLTVGSKGYAYASTGGSLTYRLKVTKMFPARGSMYGGTLVTIEGEGFGTDDTKVKAAFGEFDCSIKSITDTQIVCMTSSSAATRDVSNQGTHITYGKGFEWSPRSLTAQVGDTISWSWSTETTSYQFGVYQSPNITAKEDKSRGFSSGDQSPSGSFKVVLSTPGTYTYWSGYVDGIAQAISLHGSITVTDRADTIENLILKAGGYEAEYDVTNKASTIAASGACPGDTSSISPCSSLAGDANKFNFAYQECMTPTWDSVSNSQATGTQTIDLMGSGFAATNCQNEVTLGDYSCVVLSSSGSKITCSVDTKNTMEVGALEVYDLRISNRGYPLSGIQTQQGKSFVLLPHVASLSPAKGSVEGGLTLTIQGGGFVPQATTVMVESFDCPVLTVDYTTITCTLPRSGRDGFKTISVSVTSNGQTGNAVCTNNAGCAFQYDATVTASVTSVTPDTISGPTSLTIVGTQFGSSGVTVSVGGETCTVSSATDTQIVCTITSAPVGSRDVEVFVSGIGKAYPTVSVSSADDLTSITPSSGSLEGGTDVVIAGNGFVFNKTSVTVGSQDCEVTGSTLTSIECITPAGTAGDQTVTVVSDGTTYTSTLTFTYDAAKTPSVASVSPTSGKSGDSISISGSGFSSTNSDNVITLGGAICTVSSATSTSMACTLGPKSPGQYNVEVNVASSGNAQSSATFGYTVTATGITPNSGSLGGGQIVTISGSGFAPSTTSASVCGEECVVDGAASSPTQLVCSTPASAGTTTQSCDVVVSDNGQTASLTGAYTYDAATSPSITSVAPAVGSTSGGTTLTITGSGFGTTKSAVTVTIGGVTCAIQTVDDTQVVCQTGARSGSVDAQVQLQVNGGGNARQIGASFSYMYAWSSPNSWNGNPAPGEGEIVVIPKGMTILLDQTTPVLKMLVIQGGKVVFDEKDITLNAEYILITSGGALQIGTEEQPFQSQATIKLHGFYRSDQLPVYGSKVLAVREGTLDLHGIPTPVTWTLLDSAANAGATTITLQQAVNWPVGSEIVIATTGHRHSQSETEKRKITAVSANGLTLTLDSPLTYDHVAVTETYGSKTVELRAEVGLLTHNVKVQGSSDDQWADKIEACPDGFDTGEFVSQTCFQGRFGDEVGSDQFGSQILIHAPRPNENLVQARIEYVEVTHAGQAFRLGRYPIHFHLNGDMSTSYVRGCGIHRTFNRAVNVHGTHNLMVERTVIYNIMGGAFFLEDGIETGNTFQYNLAVFVIASTSLLNDDITPASFWVTNPNNTIQHNHAAGGTHFGFWYRMHEHPDGPSFDPNICPQRVPLGVFQNNTAHSFGWFGIWIFQTYAPRQNGECGDSAPYEVAKFHSLTSWNCEKGGEIVDGGAIQFTDMVFINNEKAGFEGKLIIETPPYDPATSYALKDSVMVGRSPNLAKAPKMWDNGNGCTIAGVVIPYGNGGMFTGVEFYNFNEDQCQAFTFTKIDGTCSDKCGAFTYHLSGLTFDTESAKRKLKFEWFHHGVLIDLDGSFTGQTAGSSLVPTMSHLPPSCSAAGSAFNMQTPASICPPAVEFIRMSFNNIVPDDLKGKDAMITTQYGTQRAYYAFKRITHPNGWAALLPLGEEFKLEFENAKQVTNISYSVKYYGLTDLSDYVVVCQALDNKPDRFYFASGGTGVNMSTTALDIGNHKHGDWTFNNVTNQMCYMVAGKLSRKRSTAGLKAQEGDRAMEVSSYKCYFTDCTPPPDPDTIPPVCTTPATAVQWSASEWTLDADGYVTNVETGSGTRGEPVAGEKVKIAKDSWVVADSTFPAMEALVLEGVLEIDDGPTNDREFTIDTTYMYIFGGKLMAGCPGDPFLGKLSIILRGSHATPVWARTEGPNIGSKVIAVFGGLDLHGVDVGRTWTRISTTAAAGSNQIVLSEDVTWSAGDEIVIAATGFNAHESEVVTIQSVAADKRTITLTTSLTYKHIAASESFANGKSYTIGAEVGLLTRNIKIIGAEYSGIETESFGARVLVGVTSTIERSYTGYGRLSNVEFVRGGQEGFTESYDPRFALSFLDAGQVTDIKPSSVSKCSFHHGYNPAIGIFGVHGIEITENVIYRTVGSAIETKSVGTRLIRNLGLYSIWRGSYNGRKEINNFVYHGTVDAHGSRDLVMQYNAFAASERALYHGPPEDCASTADPWIDNTLHTGMMGTLIMPSDRNEAGFNDADRCVQYANFTIWKCWDYGFYYNSINDVELYHNTLVDNGLGIFLFIFGPESLEHLFRDHYMKVEDALVVGQSPAFDCTTDTIDVVNDVNYALASKARSWRIGSKGKIGISTPQFGAGSNAASDKPFANMMTYQSLGGRMEIKGVTFANFQSTCGTDIAITSNPINDDAIHGMMLSQITLYNVGTDNKLFIHRPLVQMINPSDCVDMECDGHKKVLIKDLDGSYLGVQGDAFSKSEMAWDAPNERNRGIGDYRIPKQMVTYPDGTRQPYEVVAKYKGIIRESTCNYLSASSAYVCDKYNYEQLVIESMDADTETRRLSPVALLGWDDAGNGYMDLINGPQDQGWCAGYTCQKRLSTFLSVMATGRNYSVYFTGVSPQHLRYRMLNVDDTKSVGLATYYNTPNRLDVYCDGVYVLPNNGRKDSEGRILLDPATTWGQYIPDPNSGACGENYLDYDWKHQHVIVRGTHVVDIKTTPVIVLGFNVPSMSVDQFFGDNLVDNLALFLKVPASKIRVMHVVSGVDRRRKKRSTGDNTMVYAEVGNQPCNDINCTTTTFNTLSFSDLQQLAVVLINSYQAGNLSDILNITINSMSVAEPIPPVTDSSWGKVVDAGDEYLNVLKVPKTMNIKEDADGGPEGKPFRIQPRINMLDILGEMITVLGASIAPWEVSVSLKAGSGSNSLAQLTGTTNATFANGWANFSDIGISHEGSGYVLEFTIAYPTEVIFKVESGPITIIQRPLKAGIVSKTGGVFQNNLVSVALDIRDGDSDSRVQDINWKGHLWTVTASMSSPSSFGYGGVLAGTTTGTFDPSTGEVTLNDLRFDQPGFAVVRFKVESNPPGYSFEIEDFVEIISPEYNDVTEDTTKEMTLKADLDFATYGKEEFGAAVVNNFMTSGYIRKKGMSLREGSVYITVTISGNTTTVQQVIDDTCTSISSGGSFSYNGQSYVLSSYMTINNVTYYGVSCGEKDDEGSKTALIVALVICCCIIVALLCGILYWRCVVYPKTKTHKARHFNIMAIRQGKSTKCYVQPYHRGLKDPRYLGQGKNPEEIFWRENTFQSLREKSWIPDSFVPPVQTTYMEKKQNAFTGHA